MKIKRFFTPQEANKTLPLIKKIVEEILAKAKEYRELLEGLKDDEIPPECHHRKAEIDGLIDELQDLGCFYKDWNFEVGLVDFPSEIDGKQVLLCWRSDEPALQWFHSFEDGYGGRQPIPEELLNK